jgi:hypothetical protein
MSLTVRENAVLNLPVGGAYQPLQVFARVDGQWNRMTDSTGYTISIALFRCLIPFLQSHSKAAVLTSKFHQSLSRLQLD